MSKLKYIILLLVIIVIILVVLWFTLVNKSEPIQDGGAVEEPTALKLEKEENIYTYFYMNELINNFLMFVDEKEQYVDNAEAVFSLLDEQYIQKNNLKKDKILEYMSNYKNIDSYISTEIYKQEIIHIQNTQSEYLYIKGIIRKDGKQGNIYTLVKNDLVNETYSITFLKEDEFNKLITEENTEPINIPKKDYNLSYSKMFSEYEVCSIYLKDYFNVLENNINDAYNLLDTDYKNKRFGNIDEYTKYVKKQNLTSETVVLKQYSVTQTDDYTQYVCIDSLGNNYIFRVKSVMDYTVILDTYTLELPEFTTAYNNAIDANKVVLNMQKIFQAINSGDYKYVYEKLDNDFKANYFKTQADFENYVTKNFFANNKVIYNNYQKNGDVHIYNIEISDSTGEKTGTINKKMLMKLGEGTEFVMSFSVQ